MATIEIPSPAGLLHVQVDDQDADLAQYKWHMAGGKGRKGEKNAGKYAARTAQLDAGPPVTILMHREIAVRMGLLAHLYPRRGGQGQWHVSIDHDDGDKLNNRRSNLKLKTRAGQMTNPNDFLRSTNASGVRGVSWDESRQRWYACVMVGGKTLNLGWWDTKPEAETARFYWDQNRQKLPVPRRRSNKTGCVGVSLIGGRYYASAYEKGKRIALGGYSTPEEASAARGEYDAASDKKEWLLAKLHQQFGDDEIIA
jgi:hypothetical protein